MCPAVNPHGDLPSFALRPDGRVLAVAGRDGSVSLVDAATLRPLGAPLRPLSGARVYGLGYAPRSGLLVVGGAGGALVTYDPEARRVVRRLRGHSDAVWPPAFSRDGRLMATGSFDDSVRLWDLPTGKPGGRADRRSDGRRRRLPEPGREATRHHDMARRRDLRRRPPGVTCAT